MVSGSVVVLVVLVVLAVPVVLVAASVMLTAIVEPLVVVGAAPVVVGSAVAPVGVVFVAVAATGALSGQPAIASPNSAATSRVMRVCMTVSCRPTRAQRGRG